MQSNGAGDEVGPFSALFQRNIERISAIILPFGPSASSPGNRTIQPKCAVEFLLPLAKP